MGPVAKNHEPDSVFVQAVHFCTHCLDHQFHECRNFCIRTSPVLFRKCEKREVAHTGLDRCLHTCPHAFNAFEMAINPFLASFLCPSSITIHDDGDMQRYFFTVFCCHRCKFQLFDIPDILAPEEFFSKGIDEIRFIEPDTLKRKLCH